MLNCEQTKTQWLQIPDFKVTRDSCPHDLTKTFWPLAKRLWTYSFASSCESFWFDQKGYLPHDLHCQTKSANIHPQNLDSICNYRRGKLIWISCIFMQSYFKCSCGRYCRSKKTTDTHTHICSRTDIGCVCFLLWGAMTTHLLHDKAERRNSSAVHSIFSRASSLMDVCLRGLITPSHTYSKSLTVLSKSEGSVHLVGHLRINKRFRKFSTAETHFRCDKTRRVIQVKGFSNRRPQCSWLKKDCWVLLTNLVWFLCHDQVHHSPSINTAYRNYFKPRGFKNTLNTDVMLQSTSFKSFKFCYASPV